MFIFTISFFNQFIYFNWRIIALQYRGGFCHSSAWISHGCTCVPHPESLHLPPHPIPLGCPRALTFSGLLHASNLDQSSISHMVTYMFQGCSLKPSHPDLLPQSPKVCPLHVPLLLPGIQDHCYPLSKFCIYVLIHGIWSSLSDLLQSV